MGIKILNPEIAEQIAAGEVVENPASVIKELVENSLDAGATMVEIKVIESGLKEIRIIDNGSGILSDETALAFERHATSKISLIDDLQNIKTLGFRGEALASIGAVSKVLLTTRTPGELSGTHIRVEGGIISPPEETGSPSGTEIVVRDLFYNTPARLAFLKSRSQEMRRISSLLTGLAFSYPEVAFYLWNDQRLVFKTKGDGQITDIIAEAYGKDAANAMTEIKPLTDKSISIWGYISTPLLTRSTRLYQTVLINRRLVRSPLVSHTLKRGYQGLLPPNRFPLSVIYLEVPPDFVDVNIHPSKAEVRFHRDKDISDLIYKSVTLSLGRSSPSGYFKTGKKVDIQSRSEETSLLEEEKSVYGVGNTYSLHEGSLKYNDVINKQILEETQEKDKEKQINQLFPDDSYQLIGQFLASYIIAQKPEKLVLIDQHAAHERVLYEKFKKEYLSKDAVSFFLASPLTIEIPFSWEESINEVFNLLEEAGFKIETFGYNTYIIRSVPDFLSKYFNREYFMDLIERIMEPDEPPDDKREIIIKMAACKGAVKANQKLSQQEMVALISQLVKTNNSFYCPHGRPAVISYEINEIEKAFKRRGGRS